MDVRDRAILMLFAIYGLRESEVAKLRLENGVSHKFTRFSLRLAEPSPITCCRSADRHLIVRYF